MGIFSEIYESLFGKSEKQKLDEKPSTFGGDGTSPEEAVVVNCASMSMANRIINGFISDRHGEKGTKWGREAEMFQNSPTEDGPIIRIIGVKLSDGSSIDYYFNISRPLEGSLHLIDKLESEVQPTVRYQRVGVRLTPERIPDVKKLFRHFATEGTTEYVEVITRRALSEQGIDGSDVTVVSSTEDMSEAALSAYLRGVKSSGGMVQPSMFLGSEEQVYLVVPAIQEAAQKTDHDFEFFVGATLTHSVVTHKGLRDLLGGKFKETMINMFKAIGKSRLLRSTTVDGVQLSDAYDDQIQVKDRVLTNESKMLLAEMYLANLPENTTQSRSNLEGVCQKVLDYIAYFFNSRLRDTEMEKLLRSARDYRRSTSAP